MLSLKKMINMDEPQQHQPGQILSQSQQQQQRQSRRRQEQQQLSNICNDDCSMHQKQYGKQPTSNNSSHIIGPSSSSRHFFVPMVLSMILSCTLIPNNVMAFGMTKHHHQLQQRQQEQQQQQQQMLSWQMNGVRTSVPKFSSSSSSSSLWIGRTATSGSDDKNTANGIVTDGQQDKVIKVNGDESKGTKSVLEEFGEEKFDTDADDGCLVVSDETKYIDVTGLDVTTALASISKIKTSKAAAAAAGGGKKTAASASAGDDDTRLQNSILDDKNGVSIEISPSPYVVPLSQSVTNRKFLNKQSQPVTVTIRYTSDSGLKPYFLTVAKKLMEAHPDVAIEREVLPKKLEGNNEDDIPPTFEILVDGKIAVRYPTRSNNMYRSLGVVVFINMEEVETAIARAKRKRRPSTVYGEKDGRSVKLELMSTTMTTSSSSSSSSDGRSPIDNEDSNSKQ